MRKLKENFGQVVTYKAPKSRSSIEVAQQAWDKIRYWEKDNDGISVTPHGPELNYGDDPEINAMISDLKIALEYKDIKPDKEYRSGSGNKTRYSFLRSLGTGTTPIRRGRSDDDDDEYETGDSDAGGDGGGDGGGAGGESKKLKKEAYGISGSRPGSEYHPIRIRPKTEYDTDCARKNAKSHTVYSVREKMAFLLQKRRKRG